MPSPADKRATVQMHLILVITGTREPLSFAEQSTIWGAVGRTVAGYRTWQVFVGDCPTGVDAWVFDALRRTKSTKTRVFYADWRAYPKAAGPIRNRAMVDAAVDKARDDAVVKVLAFPKGKSSGTRNCIGLARKAGLNIEVTELEIRP